MLLSSSLEVLQPLILRDVTAVNSSLLSHGTLPENLSFSDKGDFTDLELSLNHKNNGRSLSESPVRFFIISSTCYDIFEILLDFSSSDASCRSCCCGCSHCYECYRKHHAGLVSCLCALIDVFVCTGCSCFSYRHVTFGYKIS